MNCGENHDCSSEVTGRVSILSMVRLVSEVPYRRSIIGRTGRRSTCRCVRVEQSLLTVVAEACAHSLWFWRAFLVESARAESVAELYAGCFVPIRQCLWKDWVLDASLGIDRLDILERSRVRREASGEALFEFAPNDAVDLERSPVKEPSSWLSSVSGEGPTYRWKAPAAQVVALAVAACDLGTSAYVSLPERPVPFDGGWYSLWTVFAINKMYHAVVRSHGSSALLWQCLSELGECSVALDRRDAQFVYSAAQAIGLPHFEGGLFADYAPEEAAQLRRMLAGCLDGLNRMYYGATA